jgi:hypothetical protein
VTRRSPSWTLGVALGLSLLLAEPVLPQEPPPGDPTTDLVNALLSGLLGFRDLTGPELQKEVAEAGGIPFRADVPVDFMTRAEMGRYLHLVLDAEYPEAKARVDQRTLVAFGLLSPQTDLRALRARVLEENIAGFYDERPGKKRLYAVSGDRTLSPANQLILSHELRHALQDQYVDLHTELPDAVGDFDDRRLAWLCLLEGDATLVMERFLMRRLPGGGEDMPGLSLPAAPEVPGAPPVVRDQLVLPYLVGLDFARAIWARGGADSVRQAWARPPESTEQVLHPEKYFARESPRPVDVASYTPAGGRLLNEGVLGEVFLRTLLGEGQERAAAGWGGDAFRVWDVGGRTLLVWRSVWDGAEDAREFQDAALRHFQAAHGAPEARSGYAVYLAGAWRFAVASRAGGVQMLSSDDPGLLTEALRALPGDGSPAAPRPTP